MAKQTKNYPGYIEKRGPSHRIEICVEGEYHRKTLSDSTREDAEKEARRWYDELQERIGAGLPGPMPFSKLLKRYRAHRLPSLAPSTRKTYGYSLTAAETYFVENGGDPDAHAIRKGHVVGFLQWRKTHSPDGNERPKPLVPRSLAKDRATLHAVFAFAEDLEIVESNPVGKTDPPKGDGRDPIILTDAQVEKLLGHCAREKSDPLGPFLRLYVLALAETGARCESEVLWLKWEDVKLEEGFIWIGSNREHRTKSGKGRWVPMTARLRQAMRDHFAAFRFKTYGTPAEQTEWVFHHPVKRRRAKAGARIGSLRRGFEAAVERAGLPPELNQHDLRHRRVTKWLAEGKPAVAVKEAMGHADLRTTMGYTHLAREHLRVLVDEPAKEELRELAK